MAVPSLHVRYDLAGETIESLVRSTPGFLIRDNGGVHYLITAGHGLKRSGSSPLPISSDEVIVDGPTDPVGTVVGKASYYFTAAGYLVDMGVVLIGKRVPAVLRQPPWSEIRKIVSTGELRAQQTPYYFRGAHHPSVEARMDTLVDSLPIPNPPLTYAGPLLYSRFT